MLIWTRALYDVVPAPSVGRIFTVLPHHINTKSLATEKLVKEPFSS